MLAIYVRIKLVLDIFTNSHNNTIGFSALIRSAFYEKSEQSKIQRKGVLRGATG